MRILMLVCGLLCTSTFLMAAPPGNIQIDDVTYKELAAEVNSLKGKVVLVDVWGMFCGPCRERLPHVIALHKKYAKDGLAVITVSVDQVGDTEALQQAKQYLSQLKAETRNVHLKDPVHVWAGKWKTNSVPLLFLFDQQGRLIERYDGRADASSMERMIRELLAE